MALRVSLAGWLIGMQLGLVISAQAHPSANYYSIKWASAQRPIITWSFDNDFPSGSGWRSRVISGANTWDANQPTELQFDDLPDVVKTFSSNCNDWGLEQNVLFFRDLGSGGGTLATTGACGQAGNPSLYKNFTMSFDSSEDWHTGTGNPPPSGCVPYCVDAWGISTHEFGHGTGGWLSGSAAGHFDPTANPGLCGTPGATDYHTMCITYQPSTSGDPARGARWRSTETHDDHTFDGAY